MEGRIHITFEKLIKKLSHLESVQAIGVSGQLRPLPKPRTGDFDIFLYCEQIPSESMRVDSLNQLGDSIENVKMKILYNHQWGLADYCTIEDIDTWMMYFLKEEVEKNLQKILQGEYLERIDKYYYPIGRLAMFQNLTVLYESDGFIDQIKGRLKTYPHLLKEKMISYNLQALADVEDLERAVHRKDVLFYHFALDLAIDHFLLALFAINETYFPSRKRSFQYIEKFERKPSRCVERLLSIIKDGAETNKIESSYEAFRQLCADLKHC